MKKIISILLAAAMVLAFAACGNNSGNNGGNDAAVTDPLEVLSKTWSSLPEEDKFPAAGGDNGSPVDDKPGKFDISDTDNLDYMLSFPAGSVDLIDSAASLTHMMNMNTFTCGAYHVKNAADAKTLAQALEKLNAAATSAQHDLPQALQSTRDAMNNVSSVSLATKAVVERNAPLTQELRRLIQESAAAVRSLRAFMDVLERNPEALLRGKQGSRR